MRPGRPGPCRGAAGYPRPVSVEGTGATTGARFPGRNSVEFECDLVMKGGITSGVVYPRALTELAGRYRFRSVGGSSAGAIAAAMAAAAEYGRDRGGFERLDRLPDEIAPVLPDLFQPGPHSAVAHQAVMSLVDRDASRAQKARRVLSCMLHAQRGAFLAALGAGALAALVVALLAVGLDGLRPADVVGGLVVFVVLLAIAAVAAAGWALSREARTTWDGLAQQGFGVCLGSAGREAPAPGESAAEAGGDGPALPPGQLTDWLADHIDAVAGVAGPLTFGDLAAEGIDLCVMTTDLSHGRPMTFPFVEPGFMFDPVELGDYFPPRVIERMVAGSSPVAGRDGEPLRTVDGAPLYPLPEAADLPVVVAARLSLSFPGLISAVPLHAVDDSRKELADRVPVRCWFSDGGITSNFPIHFFDALWPGRPTFALDLRPYHPDRPDEDVSYGGVGDPAPRVRAIRTVPEFASAILTTMQYWADEAQATLPGYRDRVVEVHQHDDEGGMNLRMPPETVLRLAAKGREAAALLAKEFDFDQHRWTRYLTSMAELQQALDVMADRYRGPLPGGASGYSDLLAASAERTPYARDANWSAAAAVRTEVLLAFTRGAVPDYTERAPRPDTNLRITPRF